MAKLTKVTGKGLTLREPAEQIWLAGLGAFAMAEEEGGKLFTTLVKKGRVLQKNNMARVEDTMGDMRDRVEGLRDMPTATMERINERFDAGMAAMLHRLGVPTKREIGTLTRRVEELTRTLEQQRGTHRSRPAARTRRTTKPGSKAVVTA